MKTLIRTIHPEIRIVNEAEGIVDYVASDETLDSYREVIRVSGWRFKLFAKNAPFVDSHDYHTIEKQLGKVVDFGVRGGKLVERVKWAIDVPENKLAQIGWAMTKGGYLKAVSVGFYPTKYVTPHSDRSAWMTHIKDLGYEEANAPRVIYLEQEQIELSSCIIGANPNALAKAYKAGAVSDEQLDHLSATVERQHATASRTHGLDHAAQATIDRERQQWLRTFTQIVNS